MAGVRGATASGGRAVWKVWSGFEDLAEGTDSDGFVADFLMEVLVAFLAFHCIGGFAVEGGEDVLQRGRNVRYDSSLVRENDILQHSEVGHSYLALQ